MLMCSRLRVPASGLALVLGFCAVASPASAAVTLRGIVPEDGPRTGWLERYTQAREGPEQIEKVSQTYKVGEGAALDVSHIAGDIRVTGGTGSEIRVDATKRVRHRDPEQGKRLLEALRVDVNNFNGRVEVRTIYPRRGSFGNNVSASVDYVISVPAGASVSLKSISGDISVTNVKGEVRAETVSGDVNISGTPNVAIAKTISGDVTAQNIGTQTTLVLSTISGTVLGTGLKVRALEAGSVSGNVRLVGSDIERLEAKSVSGNIEYDAPLAKGGRYEFT
jgi:Putative adhesin